MSSQNKPWVVALSLLAIVETQCKQDSGKDLEDGNGGSAGQSTAQGGNAGSVSTGGADGTPTNTGGTDPQSGGSGGTSMASGGQPGTGGTPGPTPEPLCTPPTLKLTLVNNKAQGTPMGLVQPDGDPNRYVFERTGVIRLLGPDNQFLPTPFIDMRSSINQNFGGTERGLLGLAFPRDHAATGKFYLYYNRNSSDPYASMGVDGDLIVAEGTRATPTTAMRATKVIVHIPHAEEDYHVGGFFGFGPDGMLYAANGDSGRDGYHPYLMGGPVVPVPRQLPGPAQDLNNLLSKILRIDVKNPTVRPPGNMENANIYVWDYGVRNPYRGSFDRLTGDMYFGDVGEASWEEINFEPRGKGGRDYGWAHSEGTHCFPYFLTSACTAKGVPPLLEYLHDGTGVRTYPQSYMGMSQYCGGQGCSRAVIGGYVYRGSNIQGLSGRYFYGDHKTNQVFSLVVKEGKATCPAEHKLSTAGTPLQNIVSFGEDATGELYVMDLFSNIYRIDPMP